MPYGTLYYGCPVNRAHPLNRGLVAEWAVVPWYASGPRWIDLSGFRDHGTLANGPLWAGAVGRPGGYGALSFDGGDDYVSVGALPTGGFANGGTLAAWGRAASTGQVQKRLLSSGNSNYIWLGTHATDGSTWEAGLYDGLNKRVQGYTIVAGAWAHVVGTWNNSTLFLYVNGALAASGGAGPVAGGSDETVVIGAFNPGGGGGTISGLIDGVQVFNRYLSASEVAVLYDQSRRGNPDRWNWLPDRAYFFAATAAATVIPNRIVNINQAVKTAVY